MPNKNYIAGRAFEYAVKKHYEKMGYTVLRTAGSHGPFDLVAFKERSSVCMIQCKRVSTLGEAVRMENEWRRNPPFPPGAVEFNQVIEIKVKGDLEHYGCAV